MARKKKKEEPENAERWLLTYADMLTLLFALFMVLYAASSVSKGKWLKLAESMHSAFHTENIPKNIEEIKKLKILVISTEGTGEIPKKQGGNADTGLKKLKEGLTGYIEAKHLSKEIKITIDSRGLVIRLATDKILFDLGSAEIKEAAKPILNKIIKLIKDTHLKNHIQIEGYTDDLPIVGSTKYKDNWDLSVARATSVLRYFVKHGIPPSRLSAAGYGEFKPIVPNINDKNRARNRRVEIIILKK